MNSDLISVEITFRFKNRFGHEVQAVVQLDEPRLLLASRDAESLFHSEANGPSMLTLLFKCARLLRTKSKPEQTDVVRKAQSAQRSWHGQEHIGTAYADELINALIERIHQLEAD